MNVLRSIAALCDLPGPIHLAIGVFDGLHLGHQAVLQAALNGAANTGGTAAVLTFHPHPVRLLRPEKAPRLLTSTQHKAKLIEQLGIQALVIQEFNYAFAATPPEQFVMQLVGSCRPLREICVGEDWTFGAKRAGNVQLLKRLADRFNFTLSSVPPVFLRGLLISSTAVRSNVESGNLGLAEELLGRPFTILGTVCQGNRLGRQLGFPTANLQTHNEQFPPDGVYAAEVRHAGQHYGGVVNIGVRPTLEQPAGEKLLEIYLFDFDQEIYGEDLEVRFLDYLRGEQKFASLSELRAQIARDVISARLVYQAAGTEMSGNEAGPGR